MSVAFNRLLQHSNDIQCSSCSIGQGLLFFHTDKSELHAFHKTCLSNKLTQQQSGREACPTCYHPIDLTSLFKLNELASFKQKQKEFWAGINKIFLEYTRSQAIISGFGSYIIHQLIRTVMKKYSFEHIAVEAAATLLFNSCFSLVTSSLSRSTKQGEIIEKVLPRSHRLNFLSATFIFHGMQITWIALLMEHALKDEGNSMLLAAAHVFATACVYRFPTIVYQFPV